MAVDVGFVTAMRCVSAQENNLYFQIQIKGTADSASRKTFVVKADDPAIGIYATILASSLAVSESTRISVSVESEIYSPQPNYHEVTQLYAGQWRP